ncbi:PstS family phosphate ABC transporter substrate-binding protein [Kribbella sp. NPDC056951]|uniref:PstS family phosphate ABC transporter substrate-binding protein n=1 Tax=Kribbella sp. NPDC056951 TaxID=3345978 RepID=UPI00363B7269
MRFTRTARATAIAAAAVALVATSALTAAADPTFTPDANDIVLVGSDTSENVLNDLAAVYNGRTPTPSAKLASWDATGTSPIVLRSGTASVTRPNGSSAGIAALCSNANVSAARSSRGPATGDCAGLAFLPFAKDSVRWAAHSGVAAVTSLTDAQLTGIYNCTITNWNQVGGPNQVILPLIPQAGSGTRTFWATQVGINASSLPSCVKDNVGGTPVQEHSPTLIKANAGAIAPFSVGRYNLLTATEKSGTVRGDIAAADSAAYDRNLYNVVKTVSGSVPAGLADVFGDGSGFSSLGGTPFVCEDADTDPATTTAGDVVTANGFLPLGDAANGGTCGVL